MKSYRMVTSTPDARTLCVTCRDFAPVMSRCLPYEFEDTVAGFDAVDVIAPADVVAPRPSDGPAGVGLRTLQRLGAKILGRFRLKAEATIAPHRLPIRHRPPMLRHDYDLLFVNIEAVEDIYTIGPLSRLHALARVSVCYIGELYAADVAGLGDLLPILSRFDHLVSAVEGTVDDLAAATGRPCHYLPPSVDALASCPYPDAPQRVVDFYAMGRRSPEAHEALLRKAADDRWYYMYDTTNNSQVTSCVDHRTKLVDLMKRSRFFLVMCARFTDQARVRGQQELGFRYFEGAATGTVMVGDAPDIPAFREHFGWPDSVIPLPSDPVAIADVLTRLSADPARLERISKTNVVNALRRHDHVYRWERILALTGLAPSAEMTRRSGSLAALAASVAATIPAADTTRSGSVGEALDRLA